MVFQDGKAGAVSTKIALALLKSLETGQPVPLENFSDLPRTP
jgi:hypothetical protein